MCLYGLLRSRLITGAAKMRLVLASPVWSLKTIQTHDRHGMLLTFILDYSRQMVRYTIVFANTMFKAICYNPPESQIITAGTDRKVSDRMSHHR